MRRGSLIDLIAIPMTAVILILMWYLSAKAGNVIMGGWVNATNTTENPTSADEISVMNSLHSTQNLMISAIPFILFFIGIAAMVLAYFVPTSPIFFPLGIFMFIAALVISIITKDVLTQFITNPAFADITNENPVVYTFVTNMPIIVAIFFIGLAVVTYSKRSVGNV